MRKPDMHLFQILVLLYVIWFYAFGFQIKSQDFCLDVAGVFYNGANVDVYMCNDGFSHQKWLYTENNEIISATFNTFCLDTPGTTISNKGGVNNVMVWECTGKLDQKWIMQPGIQDNTVTIRPYLNTTLCLDIAYGNYSQGTTVVIWTCGNYPHQIWINPLTSAPTSLTMVPTINPTANPSVTPVFNPSVSPSINPTWQTIAPTDISTSPTVVPTYLPSNEPSNTPSNLPTYHPTYRPT
eukprot:305263_1